VRAWGPTGPLSHKALLLRAQERSLSTPQNAPGIVSAVIVFGVIDIRSSPDHPLGDAVETFIRREDADLVSYLRIEERELEAPTERSGWMDPTRARVGSIQPD